MKYILGIETSCDETAASVVTGDLRVLSNVVASQMHIHAEFGGVVPEIASRNHIAIIDKVVTRALTEAGISPSQISAVAATVEPGLPGAVMVGRVFASSLATALSVPFLPVNHVHGHIASVPLTHPSVPSTHLSLVVSGGHTSLYLVRDGKIELLELTLDDAVGEAFDKVARTLNLGYPGGPIIENLAHEHLTFCGLNPTSPSCIPIQFVKKPNYHLDGFSYSGLKTAVINFLNRENNQPETSRATIPQICHSFQSEAFAQIVYKLKKHIKNFQRQLGTHKQTQEVTLCVSGGVSINKTLQTLLNNELRPLGTTTYFPAPEFCGDNAAMIAAASVYFK